MTEERNRRDYGTFTGIAVAVATIVCGLLLERGRISDLGSISAALLVLGGTLAAITLGTPSQNLTGAVRRCAGLFRKQPDKRRETVNLIMDCAALAKRIGTSAMESRAEALEEGLLKRALLLVVDGVPAQEVRRQIQLEITVEEETAETDARVFEQAGGYAPTIGIIGAVIGLIQVMRQLTDVEAVGRGIAAAFTATLYGVALANLVLLPLAARIRARAKSAISERELILEGVAALGEGLSLRLIRTRLESFPEPGGAPPLHPVTALPRQEEEELPEAIARRMTA